MAEILIMKSNEFKFILRQENGLDVVKDLEEETSNKLIKRKIKNFYNLTPRAYYTDFEIPRYSVLYMLPRYDQNTSIYSRDVCSNYNVENRSGYL